MKNRKKEKYCRSKLSQNKVSEFRIGSRVTLYSQTRERRTHYVVHITWQMKKIIVLLVFKSDEFYVLK